MAAGHHTIPPFPDDIDRQGFGHWLSGFIDGEGHFQLAIQHKKTHSHPTAKFTLGLRDDDGDIIRLIQSFWRCGVLIFDARSGKPGHPKMCLQVSRIEDLHEIVIPHFEVFPLRAKKRRDFDIWSKGIELAYCVKARRRRRYSTGYGSFPKWTSAERQEFFLLCDAIKDVRRYGSHLVQLPMESQESAGLRHQASWWD
jgi:hypothetical protein